MVASTPTKYARRCTGLRLDSLLLAQDEYREAIHFRAPAK